MASNTELHRIKNVLINRLINFENDVFNEQLICENKNIDFNIYTYSNEQLNIIKNTVKELNIQKNDEIYELIDKVYKFILSLK